MAAPTHYQHAEADLQNLLVWVRDNANETATPGKVWELIQTVRAIHKRNPEAIRRRYHLFPLIQGGAGCDPRYGAVNEHVNQELTVGEMLKLTRNASMAQLIAALPRATPACFNQLTGAVITRRPCSRCCTNTGDCLIRPCRVARGAYGEDHFRGSCTNCHYAGKSASCEYTDGGVPPRSARPRNGGPVESR